VSFLNIERGAGGASHKTIELGASGPCKNSLRAQRNAGADTSSLAPEAPATNLKKSRNKTVSARVSFLSIKLGAGAASKHNRVRRQRNLQKRIESPTKR